MKNLLMVYFWQLLSTNSHCSETACFMKFMKIDTYKNLLKPHIACLQLNLLPYGWWEEFYLEVVRKFSSSGVTRIHGDKDGTGRFEDELHTLKDKPVHLQNPAISQRGFQQGFNCIKSFYIKVYWHSFVSIHVFDFSWKKLETIEDK